MKSKLYISILIALFTLPFFSTAQDLISVSELGKLLKDKNTIIVSCRKAADYKQVHIAGAVNIWHKDLYKEGEVKDLIKSPEELAKIFGANGISQDMKIVLYDAGESKYAGRVYWILKYLGAKDVKILDGHMDAWRKGRKPVTKNPTKITAVTFTPAVDNSIIATMAQVKATKGILVDVRDPGEYNGTEGKTKKFGHIPGAINLEFKNVTNEDGTIKTKEQLEAIFKAAGINGDKEVILYCASSVRAGIVFLALTTIMNYPNIKVYDGAFQEWEVTAGCEVVK